MKIHLLTCFFRRRNITEIYLEGIKRLSKDFDIDYTFVTSEDEDTRYLTEKGYETYVYENHPLSDKWQFGLNTALQKKWDYLLIMGSDDLLSNEGLGLLLDNSYSNKGFGDIFFYNSPTKEWAYMKYEKDRLIGAGRLISREAIENTMFRAKIQFKIDQSIAGVGYKNYKDISVPLSTAKYLQNISFGKITGQENRVVWNQGLTRSLDHSSEMSLSLAGYPPHKIVSDKVHLVDIKGEVVVTQWQNLLKVSTLTDFDMWFLSDKEKNMIKNLPIN
jgi:hypothetical protein